MKDTSKKALLGASLRYIHKGNIRERVIGFIELKDMDTGTISEKLMKLLQPFELDPQKCVGFDVFVYEWNKGTCSFLRRPA